MDLIEEFRNPAHVKALAKSIHAEVTRPINIMEVCGGHTHTIMKFGIPQLLPEQIQFVHGPGCPVCIMPKERIDHALALASQEGVILATLGEYDSRTRKQGLFANFACRGGRYSRTLFAFGCAKNRQRKPR